MIVVAMSHGYPPLWNMGGEVSLHRTMKAIDGGKFVLTNTHSPYTFEGVSAKQINTPDVLNIKSNPRPIADQLQALGANVVIGQNELSLPAVRAAKIAGAVSIVNVHTPPQYGDNIASAVIMTDYAIYNTHVAAKEWGEPDALVIHPPISPLPEKIKNFGDAYTVLSSLRNKGVETVLSLAEMYPDKRFIIVRSPAERTHGLRDLEERAAKLKNVELHPRVSPEEVYKYFEQTRILLVPSRYETYGMSAIEAAGYGIPCVHVDTPHVREGIGEGAILVSPQSVEETARGIDIIEGDYETYSARARSRAEWLDARQAEELQSLKDFIKNIKKPEDNSSRVSSIRRARNTR